MVPLRNTSKPQAKTGSGDAFITLIAGAVGIVLYLAIAAAVLWGLVAR
jgi:hypothetical protein